MTSTESGTSSSSPNRSLLAQIGLLAGGVLGGLVVVGIGIFVWVLIARRRSKKKALLTPDENTDKTRRRFHSGFSGSDVSSSSYEDTTITKVPITDLSSSSPTVVQLKPAARLSSKQRSHPSGLNVVPDNRNSTGSSTTTSSVASSSTIPTSPLTKSYVPLRRSPLASTIDNPDVRGSSSPSPDNYPTSSSSASSSEGSTTNPLSSKDRSPIPPPPTSSARSSLPPSSVELVPGETEEASGSSSSFDSLASPVNVGIVEANDVSVGCAV